MAGEGVAAAQALLEPQRDRALQGVGVALLEGVAAARVAADVDLHHRDQALAALGLGDREVEPVVEELPVG